MSAWLHPRLFAACLSLSMVLGFSLKETILRFSVFSNGGRPLGLLVCPFFIVTPQKIGVKTPLLHAARLQSLTLPAACPCQMELSASSRSYKKSTLVPIALAILVRMSILKLYLPDSIRLIWSVLIPALSASSSFVMPSSERSCEIRLPM